MASAVLIQEIFLFCLVITGMLYFRVKRSGFDSAAELWMRRLLHCFFFYNLADLLCAFFLVSVAWGIVTIILCSIFKTAAYLALVAGVVSWCRSSEIRLGDEMRVLPKIVRVLNYVLAGLAIAIPIANLVYPMLFDFYGAAHSVRYHGLRPFYYLFLAVLGGPDGVLLYLTARKERNPVRRTSYLVLASFSCVLLLGAFVNLLSPYLPVICVLTSAYLLAYYMDSVQQKTSLDPLTLVNNRQNLLAFLNAKLENHRGDLYLMMLDLDFFKQINDTFGHMEGDRALVQLATAVKQSCGPIQPRPYIARYGGDEFIIIVEGSYATTQTIVAHIQEKLDALNAKNDRYNLMVSVGIGKWKWPMDDTALLAEADEDMYNRKQARKKASGVHTSLKTKPAVT